MPRGLDAAGFVPIAAAGRGKERETASLGFQMKAALGPIGLQQLVEMQT